jgi:hypothetical protein
MASRLDRSEVSMAGWIEAPLVPPNGFHLPRAVSSIISSLSLRQPGIVSSTQ